MAFFEKVNDFAKSTADKANDSIEISKLNSRIANEQSQMRDFARELGEVYWQLISAKTVAPAPEAEEICKKLELAAANFTRLHLYSSLCVSPYSRCTPSHRDGGTFAFVRRVRTGLLLRLRDARRTAATMKASSQRL